MDVGSPITSVIPSAQGPVLAVLASAERSLSARTITELAGGRASRRHVDNVLRRLVEAGVVLRDHAPPFSLYRLNRDHLAAPAIVQLAAQRDELLRRISEAVATWPTQPSAVWLFGSAARGDGAEHSDIDLLVLRPDDVDDNDPRWNDLIDGLSEKVTRWTGNDCQIAEYSESRFAELVLDGERLVSDLRRDAIRIAGDSVSRRTRLPNRRAG